MTDIEDGIRKSERIIADLQAALDELRGWQPTGDPLDAPCHSCGARIGDRCRAPSGETIEPHATRGAPA